MSGSEVAAVVVAVTCGVALTVLLVVIGQLLRTVRTLQADCQALVDELQEQSRIARQEQARVDNLLRSAESVSDTVDSATRLAYLTVGSPVVKGLALATGANQAYRRFRNVRSH